MSRIHRALNTWTVLAAIITLASHSNTSQAEPPVVPERALPIHGPFAVSAAKLSAANPGTAGTPDYVAEPSIPISGKGEPVIGEPHGPQTPQATSAFVDVAGLGGIDPGIAVGSRFVLVCDDHNGLAVYDKAGSCWARSPLAPLSRIPSPSTRCSLR
jgi:hypothetical protein